MLVRSCQQQTGWLLVVITSITYAKVDNIKTHSYGSRNWSYYGESLKEEDEEGGREEEDDDEEKDEEEEEEEEEEVEKKTNNHCHGH